MAANPFSGFKKLKDSKAQFRSILSRQQELITCKPNYPLYQKLVSDSTNKKASRSACCTSKDPSTSSISKKRKKSLAEVVNSLFHDQSDKKKTGEQRMSVDRFNPNSLSVDLLGYTAFSSAHPMLKRRSRGPLAATPESKKTAPKPAGKSASGKGSKPRHTSSVEIGHFQQDYSAVQRSQNKASLLKHLAAVRPFQNPANTKKQYHLPIEGLFRHRHPDRIASLKSEHSKGSGINTLSSGYPIWMKSQQIAGPGDALEQFYSRLCELVETSKISEKKKLTAISKMFLDYAKLVESFPSSVPINHRMNKRILEFFSHFSFVNTKAYLEAKQLIPQGKSKEPNKQANQMGIHRRSFDGTSKQSRAGSFDKSTRNLRAHDEKSSDDSNIEKELEMNHDESLSQVTPIKPNIPKLGNRPDPRDYRTNDLKGIQLASHVAPQRSSEPGWPTASTNLRQEPIYQQSQYNLKRDPSNKHLISQKPSNVGIADLIHQTHGKYDGLPRLEYETTLSRLKISQIQTEKSIVFEEEKVKLFRPGN